MILTFRNPILQQIVGILNVFDKRFEKKTFLKPFGNNQPSYSFKIAFHLPKIVILISVVFKVPQVAIHNYGTGSASNCKYFSCTIYVNPRKYLTIAKTKLFC